MPFALLIIGVFLLASAIQGTQQTALDLVVGDFSGVNNFLYWVIALIIIGSLGYVQRLKPVSDLFLALIILVLVLKRGDPTGAGGGFFSQFTSALQTTNTTEQVKAGGSAAGAGAPSTAGGPGTLTPCPNGGYTLTGQC